MLWNYITIRLRRTRWVLGQSAKLIDVLNELGRDPERNVSDLLWGKTDKP